MEYQTGMYCRSIGCDNHDAIELHDPKTYLERKRQVCKDCAAWKFYTWLQSGTWRIVDTRTMQTQHPKAIERFSMEKNFTGMGDEHREMLMGFMGR